MTLNLVYTIVKISPDLSCDILGAFENEKVAIHYLTNHINTEYNLKESTNHRVYQRSESTFEVHVVGYLTKCLLCKYHIVQISL